MKVKLYLEESQIFKVGYIAERTSIWVKYMKLVSNSLEASRAVEINVVQISSKGLLCLDYLIKFKIKKFHGNGSQVDRRWLMDLKAELRDHNFKVPASPNLWVEALFGEIQEPVRWMDSITSHIRIIVDNYEVAKTSDTMYLKHSLKDKFPMAANF